MKDRVTRRDFLKVAALSAAASAGLAGWTPGWPGRQAQVAPAPAGLVATTCGVCPRGCGLLVQVQGGQVVEITGNPAHPLSQGVLCPAAQASRAALYHPGRLKGPLRQVGRGPARFERLDWPAATEMLQQAWRRYAPGQMAFLTGLFPDHLYDLVQRLAAALRGVHVQRFAAPAELEGRITLRDAAHKLFGLPQVPGFDPANARLVFAFGLTGRESWLPPGLPGQPQSDWVWISPHRPPAARRCEWFPVHPGGQAALAQALLQRAAQLLNDPTSFAFPALDLSAVSEACGISPEALEGLAQRFAAAGGRAAAVPGSLALGGADGLVAAQSILALNALAGNLGQPGGIFLTPGLPLQPWIAGRPGSMAEMQVLVERIRSGQIKALFVHGVDPAAILPKALGFASAAAQLELLVSFSSTLDGTARLADYLLPDHTPLEAWGYQRAPDGSGMAALSALQPVIPPRLDTRSTADVLLAAARGDLAGQIPYQDEIDYLQQSLAMLNEQGGADATSGRLALWQAWQREGGWWRAQAERIPPPRLSPSVLTPAAPGPAAAPPRPDSGSGAAEFHLLLAGDPARLAAFPHSPPGYALEMHPQSARRLGLRQGQAVRLVCAAGEAMARLVESDGLRQDCVALLPSQQAGELVTPSLSAAGAAGLFDLPGFVLNGSGNLACHAGRVRVEPAA